MQQMQVFTCFKSRFGLKSYNILANNTLLVPNLISTMRVNCLFLLFLTPVVISNPLHAQPWAELAHLTSSDAETGDHFGYAVSVSGDRAIMSSNFKDGAYGDTGGGYIFERIDGIWTETAVLSPPDLESGTYLGEAVCIHGDKAIISTTRESDLGLYSGSAYIYELIDEVWTEVIKLTSSEPGSYHQFGMSVSMFENTVVIGEPGNGNGVVHVYNRIGEVWTETAILTPSDMENSADFGCSVSLSMNQLAVGDISNDHSGLESAGAVYIFERIGDTWVETDKLITSDPDTGDHFGKSLSLYEHQLIVGAPQDSDMGYHFGSAYIFEFIGDSYWEESAKITASDPTYNASFGQSVGIAEDAAIVGTVFYDPPTDPDDSVGTAYIFQLVTDEWIETKRLRPLDPEPGDEFGHAVAISNAVAFVGAFRNDNDGTNSGSTYVFGRNRVVTGLAEDVLTTLSIYPNPISSQVFQIQSNNSIESVIITDATGRLIDSSFDPVSKQVQLSTVSAGHYFLTATASDGSQNSRTIIVL